MLSEKLRYDPVILIPTGLGLSASAPDVKDGMAQRWLAAGWQQSPWVESLMNQLRRQDDLADVARLCVLFWPAENLGCLRQVSSRPSKGSQNNSSRCAAFVKELVETWLPYGCMPA
jgi:hypothetical protein